MKKKNILLLLFGIYNAISVFPALYITGFVLVASMLTLLFWTESLFVFYVLCFCLIYFSPYSCIIGIIIGIVMGICDRKKGNGCALACIILSIIGLLLFAAVYYKTIYPYYGYIY